MAARAGKRFGGAALAALVFCGPVALVAAPARAMPPPEAGPEKSSQLTARSPVPASGHGQKEANGHEKSEGLSLARSDGETVHGDGRCARGAPQRSYRVAAVNVDITLNRYLDHDPEGRMYVLEEDLEKLRAEERRNAAARQGNGDPSVSAGLGNDAIQPLTLRVNQGECLKIRLRNALSNREHASIHLHDSELRVAGGGPATAAAEDAYAAPGATVSYEWMVKESEQEATHYFHSHGDTRRQTAHGLFGAVIVEPAGSRHLDPAGGGPVTSGWQAMIVDPNGSDFREFALYYHEIGDESYLLLGKDGKAMDIVDPQTNAYRPGARALNYRSEPFMNRLKLQKSLDGLSDESVAYSSYVFGDPATPVMRAYLSDPTKQRVIHAGSEVHHVHHVHGGSIRWRRQPKTEPSGFDQGLKKHPPLVPKASERIDSQTIGPAETFDVENECGAGGCQASAGDFLFHCHVAHHYFAGMWGLWRVYNTLQEAEGSELGSALAELPDRRGGRKKAVTSEQLPGKTVDFGGAKTRVDEDRLARLVEGQLPPKGAPRGYDASVLDWEKQGSLYLNEPETERVWPGYRSSAAGSRPPLLFDPLTGKLAYPFLRPHLGKRPPFPPNHSPAPFLDPVHAGPGPPGPGENGPASVCPKGTRLKQFLIQAIGVPVVLSKKANILDRHGQLFVLKEQEAAVRADNAMRVPLAIRANAGEDCIDVVLRSELSDSEENRGLSKVNAHIHFMQFDVQASDGVIAGFNYEQSVRPFAEEGAAISAAAAPGAPVLSLSDTGRFQPGVMVGVGMDQDATFETAVVKAVSPGRIELEQPLRHPHAAGEVVSTEFVRYRWYPDVQFGTAYFHDHVNAISSWRHGLFGAVVSEPPGSTYHHPHTGEELRSGPLADIHSRRRLSADVDGSFRELVLFIQDDNPITRTGRSAGGSYNLRVEPLDKRNGPASQAFSSATHGDPETAVLEAYPGDPVVFRTLVGGTNEVHTFHLDGHWFRIEPYSKTSPPVSTAHLGISERYDLMVPAAGGPQRRPGDYLFHSGRTSKLKEGSWGILRVHPPGSRQALKPLPRRARATSPKSPVCPARAPLRSFKIAALEVPLPMLSGAEGKIFIPQAEEAAVVAGKKPAEPLVLHANAGDCLKIQVANRTPAPVSFEPDLLVADPSESLAAAAGNNPDRTVAPGAVASADFFAPPETGEGVRLIRDRSDAARNGGKGLYGAIVIAAKGSVHRPPGAPGSLQRRAAWQAVVKPPAGEQYRDFTLFLQDEDAGLGSHRMPYSRKAGGVLGLNYAAAPLDARSGAGPHRAFSSRHHGDPATPVLKVRSGDKMRIHLLSPFSEQAQTFSVEGHRWAAEPGRDGSDELSAVTVGGMEAVTLEMRAAAAPGDYLYGDHRGPYLEGGLWGILRVEPGGASEQGGAESALVAGGLALLGLAAALLASRRPRSGGSGASA